MTPRTEPDDSRTGQIGESRSALLTVWHGIGKPDRLWRPNWRRFGVVRTDILFFRHLHCALRSGYHRVFDAILGPRSEAGAGIQVAWGIGVIIRRRPDSAGHRSERRVDRGLRASAVRRSAFLPGDKIFRRRILAPNMVQIGPGVDIDIAGLYDSHV